VTLGLDADEISLGDFVLTGGEVAALAIVRRPCDCCPALSATRSPRGKTPSRTACSTTRTSRAGRDPRSGRARGAAFGDHGKVRRWRRREALRTTRRRRPDLIAKASLTRRPGAPARGRARRRSGGWARARARRGVTRGAGAHGRQGERFQTMDHTDVSGRKGPDALMPDGPGDDPDRARPDWDTI